MRKMPIPHGRPDGKFGTLTQPHGQIEPRNAGQRVKGTLSARSQIISTAFVQSTRTGKKNNAGLFPRPVAVQPVIARQGAKITQIAFVYLYARGCDRPPTPRSLVNGNYGYLSPLSFYFYILYIKKRFATAVKCTGSPLSPVLVHCSFESSFGVRGITMIKKKRSRRKRKSRRRDCVDDGADIYAARWGLPIVYCLDKAFLLLGVRQKPDT